MGIVYLIVEMSPTEDRYKIGITKNNVDKRLKPLKTGNSNELNVLNTFESEYYKSIENLLHKKYLHKKANLEWFHLTHEDISSFKQDCQKIHDNLDFLKKNNYYFK